MALDVPHLLGPAALVHAERLLPPPFRQPVEPGLDDAEPRAVDRASEALFGLIMILPRRVSCVRNAAESRPLSS
jgi:hypothetical protein